MDRFEIEYFMKQATFVTQGQSVKIEMYYI